MKSKFITVVLLLFFFISIGLYAQSHEEQRIVGTWVVENDYHPSSFYTIAGKIWVFNINGTFTGDGQSGKWAINGNNIAFWNFDFDGTFYFFLSPDGRSLYIPGVASFIKR